MANSVQPLDGHPGGLPDACRDCVFWQDIRRTTDPRRKGRWAQTMRTERGRWGVVMWESGSFQGLLQYGPAERFPRARILPAGPPGIGSTLITCAYLSPDDPHGVLERLLLEALADLKAQGVETVEAFAAPAEAGSGPPRAHHTLLERETLERLGFTEVRSEGPVALMRLPIGGLARSAGRLQELARRILPGPGVAPA